MSEVLEPGRESGAGTVTRTTASAQPHSVAAENLRDSSDATPVDTARDREGDDDLLNETLTKLEATIEGSLVFFVGFLRTFTRLLFTPLAVRQLLTRPPRLAPTRPLTFMVLLPSFFPVR